jgi:hypothetical protein
VKRSNRLSFFTNYRPILTIALHGQEPSLELPLGTRDRSATRKHDTVTAPAS